MNEVCKIDLIRTPFKIKEVAKISGLTWNNFIEQLRTHGMKRNAICRERSDRAFDGYNYYDILDFSLFRTSILECTDDGELVPWCEWTPLSREDCIFDFMDELGGYIEDLVAYSGDEEFDDQSFLTRSIVSRTAYLITHRPFCAEAVKAAEMGQNVIERGRIIVDFEDWQYEFCAIAVALYQRALKTLFSYELRSSEHGKVHFIGSSTAAVLGQLGMHLKPEDAFDGDVVYELQ